MISVGPWSFAATDEGKLVIQKADPIDPTVRYPIATFHRDDTTRHVSPRRHHEAGQRRDGRGRRARDGGDSAS